MKNNKLLKYVSIIFGVLILVWIITLIFGAGKSERNFRNKLFDVDTSAVSKIIILPKQTGQKIETTLLTKKGNKWFVKIKNGKTVSVPKDKIEGLLKSIASIKIIRLASIKPNKWRTFQVDSSSTHVKIYEGSDLAADFRVGKLDFKGRNQIFTYVRNNNENETFVTEGFLGAMFNRHPNSFRNNSLIKSDFKNWEKLSFVYPSDSSFTMTTKDNNWYAGNIKLDSMETVKYFRFLQHLSSSNFIDDFPDSLSKTPVMSLSITEKSGKTHTIKCYGNKKKWIIESSDNSEAYFDGSKNRLRERIFKSEKSLLKKKNKSKTKHHKRRMKK